MRTVIIFLLVVSLFLLSFSCSCYIFQPEIKTPILRTIFSRVKLKYIILIIGLLLILLLAFENNRTNNNANKTAVNDIASSTSPNNIDNISDGETTRICSGDNIKYEITNKPTNVDIVVGDENYDTQLAAWNENPLEYAGKVVEIEGFAIQEYPYVFIGRCSTSNLCIDCPDGYAYFEYEWGGSEIFNPLEVGSKTAWLKIIGTLTVANDGNIDYMYIDVSSIEITKTFGLDSVNN